MTTIVVLEGNSATGDRGRRYRDAAKSLFQTATGVRDLEVVFSGGRTQAAAEYQRLMGDGADVILLVDAESPVSAGHDVWTHLASLTGGDQIARPGKAGDNDAHLMSICTETWTLVGQDGYPDKNTISEFSDAESNVEAIPKAAVLRAAQAVFGSTRMKHLVLIRLAEVDPVRLRAKAPHADAFFREIEKRST